MSVITKEEVMSQLKEHFGEATDDASLKFLEDISDTISDLESKANGDGVDWKAKYEENDKAWKEKYRDRFFSSSNEDENLGDKGGRSEDDDKPSPKTFEELFNK